MSRLKHRLAPALLAVVLTLSCTPIAHCYSDTGSTWAAAVIEKAGQYGLMQGYPDGRFGVGEDMTRAQFVTVLCRLFGWDGVAEPDAPALTDVGRHWARGSIYAAAEHGAVDPAGAFRPDDPISRLEMAGMLVRALGYGPLLSSSRLQSDVTLPFSDVDEADKLCVAIAYDLGIINGVPGGGGTLKFLPHSSAPREQAAAMLVRCYERLTARLDWLHGFYAVSSYSQIGYAEAMDAVSMGWARVEFTAGSADGESEASTPPSVTLNQTSSGGNDWVRPEGAEAVLERLAGKGVDCNLCVYSSATQLAGVFDAGLQDDLIGQLVAATGPYAGLTVDFEGLKDKRKEAFSSFLADLRAALPADKTLYAAVPADKWYGGYDYRAIGEVCDKVILMAHSFQWSSVPDYYVGGTNTYSPLTPLDEVYLCLRHITDPDTGVRDRSKIALAFSFGSVGLQVDEAGTLLDTTIWHPGHATISQRLTQPDSIRVWDEASCNPNLTYTTDSGERYTLWYEDAQSVAAKLRLAHMFGIHGASIWRLGIVPSYPDIEHYDVWQVFAAY